MLSPLDLALVRIQNRESESYYGSKCLFQKAKIVKMNRYHLRKVQYFRA